MQSQIRNKIEQENANLENSQTGVMRRIKRFDRNLEHLGVELIQGVVRQSVKQKPPNQQANVDDSAPTK